MTTKDYNKLRVYSDGYDGHSLRAYYYFKDRMPDIELAHDDEQCYTAKVGDNDICWKASDVIDYEGVKYSGKDFYELVTN